MENRASIYGGFIVAGIAIVALFFLYTTTNQELSDTQSDLDVAEDTISEQTTSIANLDGDLETSYAEATTAAESAADAQATLEADLASAEEDTANTEATLEANATAAAEAAAEAADAQATLEADLASAEEDTANAEATLEANATAAAEAAAEAADAQATLEADLASAEDDVANAEATLEANATAAAEAAAEAADAQATLVSEVNAAVDASNDAQATASALSGEVFNLQSQLSDSEGVVADLQSQLDSANAEIDSFSSNDAAPADSGMSGGDGVTTGGATVVPNVPIGALFYTVDNFNDDPEAWFTGIDNGDDGSFSIASNGNYILESFDVEFAVLETSHGPVVNDFYMEVDVIPGECGATDALFAVDVRNTVDGAYYFFVSCDLEYWSANVFVGDGLQNITEGFIDSPPTDYDSVQTISILAQGNQLTLYLDGIELTRIVDSTYIEGIIGFAMLTEAITRFEIDAIRIWEIQ